MASDLKFGMKFIKYMLFVVNLTFVITSVLLITSGATIYAIYNDFRLFLSDTWFSPASLMVAVGIFMLFVSAFGCWGAIKESTCMINTFGVMLAVVFVIEFAGAIAAFALQQQLHAVIDLKMRHAVNNYHTSSEATRFSVDFLQERLYCCGVNNSSDWTKNGTIPESCCKKQYQRARLGDDGVMWLSSAVQFENGLTKYVRASDEQTAEGTTAVPSEATSAEPSESMTEDTTLAPSESSTIEAPGTTARSVCEPYKHGCLERLKHLVESSAAILGSGATAVALVQLLGVAFAFALARAIRRAKTQRAVRSWQQRMGHIIGMQAAPYTQMQEKYVEIAPVTYAPNDPSIM